MKARTAWIAGLVGIALAPASRAQTLPAPLPSAGAGSAAAAGLAQAGAAAPAAAAAPQKTIFGFFGISKANCKACRSALCQTQLGQMLNSLSSGPASKLSAGLVPPFCPPLTQDQINSLPGGPLGAESVAAKIKASEADAKARVAAIEYLGTVDCNHWPEATKALISGLRQDPNECVRYAAARVLNSGCCCSKAIIDALKVSVAGTDDDENPAETSPRVKAAAFTALQGCLTRVPEVLPPELPPPPPPAVEPEGGARPRPETPVRPEGLSTMRGLRDEVSQTASHRQVPRALVYDEKLRRKTFTRTVEEARHTLQETAETAQPPSSLPPGRQSVLNALLKARQDTSNPGPPRTTNPGPPPAQPDPARDPGVRSSSYSAPAGPATGKAPARGDLAGGGARPSTAKRGLLGSLIRSNEQGRDQ